MSLQIGEPSLAASWYESLAEADSDRRDEWTSEAARWRLAAGEPTAAGELDSRLIGATTDPKRARRLALRALVAFRASGKGAMALVKAREFAARFPDDAQLLELALRTALERSDVARAAEWGRRLLFEKPNDLDLLKRQFGLELAIGNLDGALNAAVRLVALRPQDADLRIQLAMVSQWAGRNRLSLAEWMWIVHRFPRDSFLDRAQELAVGLYEFELVVEVHETRARARDLDDGELARMTEAYEVVGTVEKAIALLKETVKRRPDDRRAHEALAELEERRGRIPDAAALLETIAQRFGPRLDEVVRLGELMWAQDRPYEALLRLKRYEKSITGDAHEYWALRAELAWNLELDSDSLIAYRVLWRDSPPTEEIVDRLLYLTNAENLQRERLAVAYRAWEKFWRADYLLAAMEAAMRVGDRAATRKLIATASADEKPFQDSEFYLLLRAELASGDRDVELARRYFERTLASNPDSRYARSGLLWLHIDKRELGRLDARLRKWAAQANGESSMWSAYAAGLHLLGRVNEALPWYARKARSDRSNFLWILSWADALAESGRRNSALRLRRYVFAAMAPSIRALFDTRLDAPDGGTIALENRGEALRAYSRLTRKFSGSSEADVLQYLAEVAFIERRYNEVRVCFANMDPMTRSAPALRQAAAYWME